jgi:hypothetical protein
MYKHQQRIETITETTPFKFASLSLCIQLVVQIKETVVHGLEINLDRASTPFGSCTNTASNLMLHLVSELAQLFTKFPLVCSGLSKLPLDVALPSH